MTRAAGPLAAAGVLRVGVQRGAGQQPGAGQHDVARLVRELERGGALGHQGLEVAAHQHGAPRCPVLGGHLGQLLADDRAQRCRVLQQRGEVGDRLLQGRELRLQLGDLQGDQPAQLHVQHVAGLHVRQPDLRDELGPRLGDVLRAADDRDHAVDVEQGDQQALDEVRALGRLAQPEARAPGDHVDPVRQEHLEQLDQAQRARLTVDQRDVVDPEALLERGQPVELGEHGLAVEPGLDLEDQVRAELAVGEVLDVGDALQLLAGHQLLHLGDHALRAHPVRQLGDRDRALAAGERAHLGGGAHAHDAAPGLVRRPHLGHPEQLAAGRQVRPGDEAHQVVEVGSRVGQQVARRVDDLDQVVRDHVGRHADGDAGGPVDEQVRHRGRQDRRLRERPVVVVDEVDGLLVEPVGEQQGRRREAALGVATGCGRVVGTAPVPVPVDERDPHRERLRQPHHRVVDRRVAVRVVLAHDVADDAGALDVRPVRAQAGLRHRVQDPAVHRLEAVAGVGQRPRVDDGVGVVQVAGLDLLHDVGVDDRALALEGRDVRRRRPLARHQVSPFTCRAGRG